MIRSLHRLPGLVAAALLVVLALSGAALSVLPAVEAAGTPAQQEADLSVAELAARVAAAYPGVEQIKRAPSGRITAWYYEDDRPGAAVIDPATGRGLGSADKSAFERWMTNLHRSLFLDDAGRLAAAAGAAAMLALTVSGLLLVARRTGGWRRFFSPLKGPLTGRLHVEIARIAAAGLLLSSATALWMTASTFGLLPEGPGAPPMPSAVSGRTGYPAQEMAVLRETPVSSLRELTFPYPGDATDVFTLKTDAGQGYIDQGTGTLLAWADLGSLGPGDRDNLHAPYRSRGCCAGPRSRRRWRWACPSWREQEWSCGQPDGADGRASRPMPRPARPTRSFWSAAKAAAPGALPQRCTLR